MARLNVKETEPVDGIPSDLLRDADFSNIYCACEPYTETSVERMHALYQATRYLLGSGIVGDIVECGVWRGGSMMLAAMTLCASGDQTRTLWLYDTFLGMTEPGPQDIDHRGRPALERYKKIQESGQLWNNSPLEEVRAAMQSTGYPEDRLQYVPGPVEETIPACIPSQIALLRLDTDWYASTYHELVHLYPLLIPGGVLIIDDYGHWQGAREAVDQYLSEQGIMLLLNRVDYTGRMAIKPFDVVQLGDPRGMTALDNEEVW